MFKDLLNKRVQTIISLVLGSSTGYLGTLRVTGQVLKVTDETITIKIEKIDTVLTGTTKSETKGKNIHIPISKIISIIEL